MNKPLIFLDIDGVLNTLDMAIAAKAMERKAAFTLCDADPVRVGILKWIVDMTDAQIVISSTWRYGRSYDWFIGYFEGFGWPDPPIVGCTEDLPGIRGDEVEKYLTTHYSIPPLHIILDDDSDFNLGQPFLHINRNNGLCAKHAVACVDILGLKNEDNFREIEDLRETVSFQRDLTFGTVRINELTKKYIF